MAKDAGGGADSGHLFWGRFRVQGRAASCAVGGRGMPVLFIHGWGLGHRTYGRPLRRLVRRGCRVYAPALPGFGGTAPLPADERTIPGYARWVDDFLEEVELTEPALVVGHSFGGGVAVALAHAHPDRVRSLVLLNSVGGATFSSSKGGQPGPARSGAARPPWEWGINFGRELFPPQKGMRLVSDAWRDVAGNLVNNPMGLLETGLLAARADLRRELAELKDKGIPVLALRGQSDGVIPLSAFEALCEAAGTEGRIVMGNHSWLLADPRSFDEVMANVLEAQSAAPEPEPAPETAPPAIPHGEHLHLLRPAGGECA